MKDLPLESLDPLCICTRIGFKKNLSFLQKILVFLITKEDFGYDNKSPLKTHPFISLTIKKCRLFQEEISLPPISQENIFAVLRPYVKGKYRVCLSELLGGELMMDRAKITRIDHLKKVY